MQQNKQIVFFGLLAVVALMLYWGTLAAQPAAKAPVPAGFSISTVPPWHPLSGKRFKALDAAGQRLETFFRGRCALREWLSIPPLC